MIAAIQYLFHPGCKWISKKQDNDQQNKSNIVFSYKPIDQRCYQVKKCKGTHRPKTCKIIPSAKII